MTNETPFYFTKIECPICKTVNEFETIRVGAYNENGRDTDFCPQEIQWRYPKYNNYNPLVFFTAVCSNCYYTREFNNSFKEWKNDNNFRSYRLKSIKTRHLDKLSEADSVIKMMAESIDVSKFPNESAIVKLHLAIYDELLNDRVSNLDLGRFYLRVGWVFRQMEKVENPNVTAAKSILMEIDNKYGMLKSNLAETGDSMKVLSRHLESQFESDQLPQEIRNKIYPYREKFSAEFLDINNQIESLKEKIKNLVSVLNSYKSLMVGGDPDGFSLESFGSYASFTDFLIELKRSWPEAAANEFEALEKAVQYYKASYVEGKEIPKGNQQLQATYLIAELSHRIGDYDQAREYFNSTIKAGQDFIYQNRTDKSRTALARKILELAIEQGKANMEALKAQ